MNGRLGSGQSGLWRCGRDVSGRVGFGSGGGEQELGRGDFQLGGEGGRDGDGLHGMGTGFGDAGDDDTADGAFLGGAGFDATNPELIGDGACAYLLDEEVDFDDVLEAERAAEVAGGVDAGESDGGMGLGHDHGEAEGAEEGVLGVLHVAEEVGEMDDAGHVGFVEFDAASSLEIEGHVERFAKKMGGVTESRLEWALDGAGGHP